MKKKCCRRPGQRITIRIRSTSINSTAAAKDIDTGTWGDILYLCDSSVQALNKVRRYCCSVISSVSFSSWLLPVYEYEYRFLFRFFVDDRDPQAYQYSYGSAVECCTCVSSDKQMFRSDGVQQYHIRTARTCSSSRDAAVGTLWKVNVG